MSDEQKKAPQGLRYDAGKVRLELLSPIALIGVARVSTKGAKKYADHNWRKGMAWSKVIGSLFRHFMKFMSGEDYDSDPNCPECVLGIPGTDDWVCKNHTGELHVDQITWNAMALSEYYRTHRELDDRCKILSSAPTKE